MEKIKIDIPYLDRVFPLEFPKENLLAIAEPNDYPAASAGQEAVLREALRNPLSAGSFNASGRTGGGPAQSFADFIRGGKKFLVIVNDATRPTPTGAMLGVILPELEKAGVRDEALTLIVAAGAHRAPTIQEYRRILGAFHERLMPRTIAHDARNSSLLADLGRTRNGTPILLNKILFESDRIVVTGSVEPHYFAGYSGGRKAFLPGIAGFDTIQTNHTMALSPGARSLALDGNPVHEDMMDALKLIKAPVFSFMAVQDKEQKVTAAACGDIMASFYAAVAEAKKVFCVRVPGKADIVAAAAKAPMDMDLYQAQKAIDNGALALKDGGTLVLVASCRDGIGDETYAKLLEESSSPRDAIERIKKGFKLGYHKAARMAEVSERAAVIAVTELPPERLKKMFIGSAATPQKALDEALSAARAKGIAVPKILVLPDGCVTAPVV